MALYIIEEKKMAELIILIVLLLFFIYKKDYKSRIVIKTKKQCRNITKRGKKKYIV